MSLEGIKVDRSLEHGDNAITVQDITNPALDNGKYGDPDEKMKALCFMGKNDVKVLECPKPRILEDRDVILKVTGSTVCGSDLHLIHGSLPQMEKGDILGHEFCGTVHTMGPKAAASGKFKQGDRVVASFQIACGECYYCKKGLSSVCIRTNSSSVENALYGGRTAGMFGYSHLTASQTPPPCRAGGFAGGQAEYVRVPLGDVNLLKLPDDVSDEEGLYLSDVICTSWNCVVDTPVKQGDVVAIWGAGPIGQMAAAFAFMNGAERVILIDQNWRLDFVKTKLPKVETVNFSQLGEGGVPQKLKEMTGGLGPDCCLECVAGEYPKSAKHAAELAAGLETDTPEILNEMIESVQSFGRIGITGIYVGTTNGFNIGSIMERGISFKGNGQAPVQMYWHDLLKKIQDGQIKPLDMVTHRVRMEDLETVYDRFNRRADGMSKVFVQTKFSAPACKGSPELTVY